MSPTEFRNRSPTADATVGLKQFLFRIGDHPFDPFVSDPRPVRPQPRPIEVWRRLHESFSLTGASITAAYSAHPVTISNREIE